MRGIFITEDHASHVTFRGRGIIDMTPWNEPKGRYIHRQTWQAAAINLSWTTDARIDGLIIKQNTDYGIMGGGVRNVTIDNVKIFSSHEWSDGIDMMSSNHVTIRRCFLGTSDDCLRFTAAAATSTAARPTGTSATACCGRMSRTRTTKGHERTRRFEPQMDTDTHRSGMLRHHRACGA